MFFYCKLLDKFDAQTYHSEDLFMSCIIKASYVVSLCFKIVLSILQGKKLYPKKLNISHVYRGGFLFSYFFFFLLQTNSEIPFKIIQKFKPFIKVASANITSSKKNFHNADKLRMSLKA